MRIAMLGALLCLGLCACGDDDASSGDGGWEHCRVEGLKGAGGLAAFENELLAVAGGGDKNVYAIAIRTLEHGGTAHARGLKVSVEEEARLSGAEPLAEQDFTMKHLWALPVDFRGAASQAPNFAYLGDRNRRVVYWGRLFRDPSGRLARLHLTGLFLAPGATRSGARAGDWRDKGPGLSGMVAVEGRRRTEDLYVIDRGEPGDTLLRVRKVDRFGSVLGGLACTHELEGEPDLQALSWREGDFHLLRGGDLGRLLSFREPQGARAARLVEGEAAPAVAGVSAWTGMCHGKDGTLYLVSDGTPAVIAWRKP